jgi:hypothetical protein
MVVETLRTMLVEFECERALLDEGRDATLEMQAKRKPTKSQASAVR